ncbi:TetR/AcrR family transcriptional regulator [Mycolicibacterium houstonense]|uniref:TetR/AcrR family transcriptional regulator n=1 Tax=Mycolicibacterium houstonense TaxID=146021 RepID=UPI003D3934B1
MSTGVSAGRGRIPELTGDARVDRWREHRAAVRAELIEATLRGIDEYGPDLSIDDVVKTAGIPRPKLYRFFEDKDALFAAVGDRVQELVVERVMPRFDLTGTARDFVRSALVAYVDLVDERPNIFRFLVNSHFTEGRSPNTLIDSGRPLSDAIAEVASAVLRGRGGRGDELGYVVDAALGAVGLGVLRWLNTPTIDKDALVEEISTFLWGAFSAAAASRGVVLDPDEQLMSAEDLDF